MTQPGSPRRARRTASEEGHAARILALAAAACVAACALVVASGDPTVLGQPVTILAALGSAAATLVVGYFAWGAAAERMGEGTAPFLGALLGVGVAAATIVAALGAVIVVATDEPLGLRHAGEGLGMLGWFAGQFGLVVLAAAAAGGTVAGSTRRWANGRTPLLEPGARVRVLLAVALVAVLIVLAATMRARVADWPIWPSLAGPSST